MNTQQPEALRLADELRAAPERSRTSFEAATELRRLHEENERLKAQQQEPTVWTATRLWNRKDTWTCPADIEKDLLDGRVMSAQQQEPVAWRELCRRLYMELYWCDRQMMETLDQDGEPMWTQGKEVRDVLADAKAALDTSPPNVPTARASKPLTDDEIDQIRFNITADHHTEKARKFTRAIEAAHGIK